MKKPNYQTIIQRALATLDCFPEEYRDKFDVKKMIDLAETGTPQKHLFLVYMALIPFIADHEKTDPGPAVMEDYMLLIFLNFFSASLADRVIDEKKLGVLPGAYIIYREMLFLAEKLGIDSRPGLNCVAAYYCNPIKLVIGKIEMAKALDLSQTVFNCYRGFQILIDIIAHFTSKFVPQSTTDWPALALGILVYYAIHDDCNDFVTDYKAGVLTSLGIRALASRFKKKRGINLKNPLTSFQFQWYVLKNLEKLYQDFVDDFYEFIREKGLEKNWFDETFKELKLFTAGDDSMKSGSGE